MRTILIIYLLSKLLLMNCKILVKFLANLVYFGPGTLNPIKILPQAQFNNSLSLINL